MPKTRENFESRENSWGTYSMEKDELLQELAYLDQAEYIDKQACVQLVKIVEQHFYQKSITDGICFDEQAGIMKCLKCGNESTYKGLPDTEAEQKIPPTVFSEKLVEDCWKEHDAKVDKERAEQSGEVDEEKKIEEIRMMIQKATSDYMPVYRRIYLNDAVEVEIRKLLTRQPQKRTVTRVELRTAFNKHCGIIGDTLYLNICNLEDFAEELDIEIVEKDEEEDQPPMDKETAGDMKYHELKDEDRLDEFGRRKL